jgi:hypothetical protein
MNGFSEPDPEVLEFEKICVSLLEILEKSQKAKGLFFGNCGTHRLPSSILVNAGVRRDGINFVRGNRVSFVGRYMHKEEG